MTFEEADELLKEILVFLNKQGGAYHPMTDVGTIQRNVLTAISKGCFFYDQTAFVSWEFFGDFLHIHDAAGDFRKIRRVIRNLEFTGISWYRNNRKRRLVSAEGKRC